MTRHLQDKRKQEGTVKTSSRKMAKGTVKDIVTDERYGFLEIDTDRQFYFNKASVLDGHFGRLSVGTRVRFAVATPRRS